ncbi:oxidoreductase, short chain dehydrogenase/reductase [Streptococcus pyogenes]|nr:oxidoreductase, short chain dehydrogenase/reductase [Streptococcus pyogenes]
MGNIALVTGASAGFGRAIVEHLIADGIKVIGASRRLEKLKVLETRQLLPFADGCHRYQSD